MLGLVASGKDSIGKVLEWEVRVWSNRDPRRHLLQEKFCWKSRKLELPRPAMRLLAAGGKPVLQEGDSQHEPGAPGGADGSTQVLLKR